MKTTIDSISYGIVTELDEREYVGGVSQKIAATQCKFNEVLIALHDAISSPKGVVPESASDFYCHRYFLNLERK